MNQNHSQMDRIVTFTKSIVFPAILDDCWMWQDPKTLKHGRREAWEIYKRADAPAKIQTQSDCKENCVNHEHFLVPEKKSVDENTSI